MDPHVLKALEETDWHDVTRRLLRYAASLTGTAVASTRVMVTDCSTTEDLVYDAIKKFLDGVRRWEPTRSSLLHFLKGIIRSNLHHQWGRMKQHPSIAHLDADDMQESGRARGLSDAAQQASQSVTNSIVGLEDPSYASSLRTRLEEKIRGNEGLELVCACLSDGISTPRKIAETIDKDVSCVYDPKRQLKRMAERVRLEIDQDLQGGEQ